MSPARASAPRCWLRCCKALSYPPAITPTCSRAAWAGSTHFSSIATGGEKYATVFYCLLDQSGRLDYVNAAHCPPIVVRPGGVTEELAATGVPVGLLEGSTYELAGRQLSPGDKLVIYTDGVTEAQDARGAFFGRKRLFDLVRAQAAASAAELHDAIQGAVRDFTEGAPQSDDITLVVLDYRG